MRAAFLPALVLTSCAVASCNATGQKGAPPAAGGCFGCGSASFTLLPNEILDVYVYAEGGKVEHCKLAQTDEKYWRLVAWLNAHSDNWSFPFKDSSPPIIVVQANQFTISFRQSGVVVLANNQYWRSVGISDYDYLRCQAGP